MWRPDLSDRSGPLYRAIAACLAEDIEQERLEAGARLPPMRDLAESLQVTVGTVHRAYALAEKQGLVSRETGRGTFVREPVATAIPAYAEADAEGTVDLTRNEPPEIPVGATLKRTLAEMTRDSDLEGMLSYGHSQGQPRHRRILAQWIAKRGYQADPDSMILCSGAQQGLTIALGGLARAGDALMVEELTYPGIKSLARLFGLRLIPVQLDRDGLVPDSFEAACRQPGARLLYCMPNVQNPTTASLPEARRTALAELARRHQVTVIEDDVNPRASGGRLPSIAELYAERTVYITSLSKTVAPGLRVGAVCAPQELLPDLIAASQTTSWMVPPLMAEVACRWVEDGTADELMKQRNKLSERLNGLAAEAFSGIDFWSDRHNTHLWLSLATPWSGEGFAARAAEQRVTVSAGERFAMEPGGGSEFARGPGLTGVRLCLANVPEAPLRRALETLATLLSDRRGPMEFQM